MQTYDANKTTPEVRQGSRRMMNLRVLIISLVAIVAVFGILFAISTAIQPGGTGSVNQPGVQPATPEAPSDGPVSAPTPAI